MSPGPISKAARVPHRDAYGLRGTLGYKLFLELRLERAGVLIV